MSELIFDPNNTILSRMDSMNRTEIITLGEAICAALPNEGCHGAIWPGAVTILPDGSAVLDRPLEGEILNLSAEALEYAAPELFWHGKRSPAADVYAVGMILYCAMDGGKQPFYPIEGEIGVKERADALRRRMKGEPFPEIPGCGKKFGAVIMKAVSYDETERYQNPTELMLALETCPVLPAEFAGFTPAALMESDPELAHALDEEMGTNAVAEAEARSAAKKEYKVDKDFEPPAEPKKKNYVPVIAVGVIIALLALMSFALHACNSDAQLPQGEVPVTVSPSVSDPVTTVSPDAALSPEVTESPNASEPAGTASPDLSPSTSETPVGNPGSSQNPGTVVTPKPTSTSIPTPTLKPTPTPVQTSTPTPMPTPTPTSTAATTVTRGNFTMVLENATWDEAQARCEVMGGHLAVIHNEDELQNVIEMAEELGAKYVWLGAKRNTDTGEMEWVTGENIDFYVWDLNEPSYKDGYDGTPENYLLLWNVSFGDHSGWKYNDSRPDLYDYSPRIFGGKIAYICQTD
ncbi:MAG: lectin-like protein [Oscillospiraceae bacterium]